MLARLARPAALASSQLCLDPKQRAVLAAEGGGLAQLDARRMMDTVRGMFVVDNMSCGLRVLSALRKLAAGELAPPPPVLVRSKNRFLSPSGGGWVDDLINVALDVGDGLMFACELQIVHK